LNTEIIYQLFKNFKRMKKKMKKTRSFVQILIATFFLAILASSCSTKVQEPVVSFQQKPGELLILIDEEPFATYIYEDPEITRPYFAHVKTSCGIQATRNHPPQSGDPQDHATYHPGIWLSFGDINGNDYWRIKDKVEHEMFVDQPKGGPGEGTFTVRNYYMDKDGKTRILAELAKYTVQVKPSGTLLLWSSTFSSETDDFTFGDQEEMGLGMRLNTELTVQYGQGHITNAEGMKDGKEVWGKASKWVDYSGKIGDNYVGMTIMPDPGNFRPSWYHARDYGFVAANPFGREAMKQGEKSAVTVRKGEKLHLGFGIYVYCNPEGTMPKIDQVYQDYLNVLRNQKSEQGQSRGLDGYSSTLEIQHVVVAGKKGRYMGWPANNGLWSWDDGREILVGYTDGPFVEQSGHNIGQPQLTKLARSLDGGKTWVIEDPENFVGKDEAPVPSPGNIQFGHPDFALRVSATGYHGNEDPVGRFFISYDRGKTWEGSYRFNGLHDASELEGMEITSRTSYLVTGENSAQIIMTARNPKLQYASRRDKPFILETTDGGMTFKFISWVVPWSDQDNRAAMPSVVRTQDGKLIVAVRVRNPRDEDIPCWIDSYISEDNGRNWSFLSRVGETGLHNGNPPALAVLNDGRLACSYANRNVRQMLVHYSSDNGATWGEATVIRDNPYTTDMGYPQLTQNADGEMVALYYLAREERPHSYIEAAIWKP
jgi:hypothetical protein